MAKRGNQSKSKKGSSSSCRIKKTVKNALEEKDTVFYPMIAFADQPDVCSRFVPKVVPKIKIRTSLDIMSHSMQKK